MEPAEPLSVDSLLDAVTVYAEGAICRRVARAPVREAQALRLQLTGLPLSMLEHSLRASVVSGPDAARVRDVRPGFDVSLPSETGLPEDHQALLRAREEVLRLSHKRDRLLQEISDVAALKPSAPPRAKDEPTRASRIDATLALAGFVDEQLRGLNVRRRELEATLEDAENEMVALQRRLEENSSAQRQARARLLRTAVITLSPPAVSGEVQVALEYLVPGATWAPAYELRLSRSLDKGALSLRATVAQRTGEDWKGVKLSLSTARLDRRIEVPELASLRIGKRQPPAPRSGWREPPPGLEELFTGYDVARAALPATGAAPYGAALPGAGPEGGFLPPSPSASLPGTAFGAALAQASGGSAAPESLEDAPWPEASAAEEESDLSDEDDGEDFMDAEKERSVDRGRPAPMAGARGGGAMARSMARAPARPVVAADLAPPPPRLSAAPAPGGREMRRKRSSTREMPAMQLGGLRSEMREEPEADAELELSTGLLDYARLVMGGPDEGPRRGKLRPPTPGEAWELQLSHRVTFHLEVETILVARRQEAARTSQLPRPPHAASVREAAGSYDYRFDAERRVDVVADGVWHTVPICGTEVSLAPEYVCVPGVDPKVYRTVKLHNVSRHAFLAGPMDVTLDDEFLMTVPLPTLVPGAEQRVGLGVEEGLKVSRNTRFNESTGGIFGGATVLEHDVEIEVANRLAHAVDVEIQERVPVSQEKDIKIDEGPVLPPWAVDAALRDGAPVEGARLWKLKLAANESRKLSAHYTVRIPGQKVLLGGNRRV